MQALLKKRLSLKDRVRILHAGSCFTLNHLFYMSLGTQYLNRIVLMLRLKLLELYVI